MNKLILTAGAAAGMMIAPANAALLSAEFIFKGDGLNAVPVDNRDFSCGSGTGVNSDFCTADDNAGFDYQINGINLNVTGWQGFDINNIEQTVAGGGASIAEVIQDIRPANSGLGVFSNGENRKGGDDQVQLKANGGESLRFDFSDNPIPVILSNIEFNSGADQDCSDGGEGGCGFVDLYIDGLFEVSIDINNVNVLAGGYVGRVFEFVATSANNGFAIGSLKVQEVPIPGALPLLLSGIAGLGFAARRKKTAS